MTNIQIKKGFTDAKKAGDATYFKGIPCMLCKGHMYWVRGHRCAICNPQVPGKAHRRGNDPAKGDNYKKTGEAIAGHWQPEQNRPWPKMQFEDVETADYIGSRTIHKQAYSGQLSASSAATTAEG